MVDFWKADGRFGSPKTAGALSSNTMFGTPSSLISDVVASIPGGASYARRTRRSARRLFARNGEHTESGSAAVCGCRGPGPRLLVIPGAFRRQPCRRSRRPPPENPHPAPVGHLRSVSRPRGTRHEQPHEIEPSRSTALQGFRNLGPDRLSIDQARLAGIGLPHPALDFGVPGSRNAGFRFAVKAGDQLGSQLRPVFSGQLQGGIEQVSRGWAHDSF